MGESLISAKYLYIRSIRSSLSATLISPSICRVSLLKKPSTRFNQDPCKDKFKPPCHSYQILTCLLRCVSWVIRDKMSQQFPVSEIQQSGEWDPPSQEKRSRIYEILERMDSPLKDSIVSLSGGSIGNPFRSARNRELVPPFRWFKPWDNNRCILVRRLQYRR